MRLLTHNMLCCLKCNHFPLTIQATEIKQDEEEQPASPEQQDDGAGSDDIEEEEEEEREEGVNPRRQEDPQGYARDYVRHMLPKIEWSALLSAVQDIQFSSPGVVLPETMPTPESLDYNPQLQQVLYRLLNNVKIIEGLLVCSQCQTSFTIKNGIPNLLLRDDQV